MVGGIRPNITNHIFKLSIAIVKFIKQNIMNNYNLNNFQNQTQIKEKNPSSTIIYRIKISIYTAP